VEAPANAASASRPCPSAPPTTEARATAEPATPTPTADAAWPPAVAVTAEPDAIYIEKRYGQSRLNFDFALENKAAVPLVIAEVEVSVFDAKGKLVLRKFINGNGFRPAIQTLPTAVLPPNDAITVFNPFSEFDAAVDLHELRYRFTLTSEDREKELTVESVVHPVVYEPKTALSLPLKGRILVHDGHDFYAHHRRVDIRHFAARKFGIKANFARYSYDLCAVDEAGSPYRNSGAKNEDWFSFGAPVFVPAAGTIAAAHDGVADNVHGEDSRFNPEDLLRDPMSLNGNYVVIDHGNGEFSLFAHLQSGSVAVKAGDKVKRGQPLAKMGSSGDASMPHLHYELRSGASRDANGVPSYFTDFRRRLGSTSIAVPKGQIDSGDLLVSP
jgi:hypothetical protein